MDIANWGTMNIADTHLPGSEWAKEARAAILEAGWRLPGPEGGDYELERDTAGKLTVIAHVSAQGYRTKKHRVFPERQRQG